MYIRPFMGCAYYPEDWDEAEIAYDIKMMKEAGITCARIGEFAWRKMERPPLAEIRRFAYDLAKQMQDICELL